MQEKDEILIMVHNIIILYKYKRATFHKNSIRSNINVYWTLKKAQFGVTGHVTTANEDEKLKQIQK